MNSTLLQRPTHQLELMLWSRQLQRARFDEVAALRFLSNAVVSLRDAKTPDMSPVGRYLIAHEGIYALTLGTLYLHGLLPREQEGSRAMALQLGFELLEMSVGDLHQILQANRHLEEIASSSCAPVSRQQAHDLVALGDRALEQTRNVFPDWFF